MKIKLRKGVFVFSVLSGMLLLSAGLGWNSYVLPVAQDRFMGDGSDQGGFDSMGDQDEKLLEGRIGLMSLIWEGMDDTVRSEGMPGVEDFDTIWKDVYVTSGGVFEKGTGKKLMDEIEMETETEGPSFPSGGVEARDYEIFNSALNRTVTVRYQGTKDVFGREGYVFGSEIEDEVLDGSSMSFGDGFEMEDAPFDLTEGIEYLYSDNTGYVLDPRTSIPYDLQLDISSSFIFPDMTLLAVMEEQVQYSEETIWIPDTTIPGRMQEVEVLREKTTRGRIDPDNDLIGLYTLEVTLYDRSTGEPLPQSQQPSPENFAVDRETYEYILGYKGTSRTGFFQFPVGSIMKRDYPMWDESIDEQNIAVYSGESTVQGSPVFIYTMTTNDVVVDGGNALLPIYYHPGTVYTIDTIQKWFIDARTGFMLDFTLEGTIRVSSAGPFRLVNEAVGSFVVDLPENTTSTLMEVSDLFRDFLLPMSGRRVEAFAMELSFTEGLQRDLVEVADQVAFYMDLFQRRVPMVLVIVGALLISLPISILLISRIRRRKERRS